MALGLWLQAFAGASAASLPPDCTAQAPPPASADAREILCAQSEDRAARLSLQFGRRMSAATGMLGQFDGFLVDYQLAGGTTLNAVLGYPALASDDAFNDDRRVLGIGATTRKFAGAWDLSSYLVDKQADGGTESRAIGGAARQVQPDRALLLSLDYDVGRHALGTLMISGAWKPFGSTTLSATLDLRHSDLRTPQERYLQQTLASTRGWKRALPMDRIKELASGGAGGVQTLALGLAHRLSGRLDLSGDFAVLQSSDGALADPAQPGSRSAAEYFGRVKLSGSNLLSPGGQSALDLRHKATAAVRATSATLDATFALDPRWRLSPRLHSHYQHDQQANAARWAASSDVKIEYRWQPGHALKIAAGGEWTSEVTAAGSGADDRFTYYLNLNSQVQF